MIMNVKSNNNEEEYNDDGMEVPGNSSDQINQNNYNDTVAPSFENNNNDDKVYIDGESNKPKLVLIIGGSVLLILLVLFFFFACGKGRGKSNDSTLSYIKVTEGQILPSFSKKVLDYDVAVNDDIVTITCSATNKKAKTSGCNKRITIDNDCLEHTIMVTAQDSTKNYYVLNICKQSEGAPIIKEIKLEPEKYTTSKIIVTVIVENTNKLHNKPYSFDGGKVWQSSNSFTVTENKVLKIQVRDINDKKSIIVEKNIETIDKTSPKVSLTGSVASGKETTSNVKLTAKVDPSTTVSGYKYQWYKGGNSISGATSSTYTATSSGTYKVKVTTGAGNSKESNDYSINIKTISNPNPNPTPNPTPATVNINNITGNVSSWTSNNVTLKVSASASNGLNKSAYSFDGGSNWQSSNSKTFDKNQTVEVVVRDTKGNKSGKKSVVIDKIDKTVPQISISGNSYVGNILTVSVSPNTTISGYKYQWYSNDTAIKDATSKTYTPLKSGTYKVKVITGANNATTSDGKTVSDQLKPTVVLNGSVTSGIWTNKDVVLTAMVNNCSEENNCKIEKYEWYNGSTKLSDTSNKLTVATEIVGTYKVKAITSNGNPISGTFSVNIDKTAPTCSSKGGRGWSNENQVITGTCQDSKSGCKQAKVTKTYTTTTNAVISPGDVYDNAGNKTVCSPQSVKVDKTPPTCKLTVNSSNLMFIEYVDKESGVYSCSTDGKNYYNATCSAQSALYPAGIPIFKSGVYKRYVKDNVGNTGECSVEVK